MTDWAKIAEELREAVKHLDKAESKLGRVGWKHIRRRWWRFRDEALEFADWATEQAEVFVTNKEPTE